MKPGILASARKHGIPDEDPLHALRNAIIEVLDDDIVMIIGPNRHGNLIEIAMIKSGNKYLIIHAMQARENTQGENMTKSIAEIILHAEKLIEKCENFDLGNARPLTQEESSIMHAAVERGISDEDILAAFTEARSLGASWEQIGESLGLSAHVAHANYSALIEKQG